MDPLSAGAGAVAFITVATQSTKFLVDFFSAIKDSPKYVQNVRHDVEQLRVTLMRLSKCQSIQDDHTVTVLVQRCSEDVALYTRRLLKLQITPAERRAGKLWKKLTAVMTEKDLREMRTAIHSHISSLSLQVSLVQLDLMLESRDQLNLLASTVVSKPLLAMSPDASLSQPHPQSELYDALVFREKRTLEGLARLPRLINTENHILRAMEARVVIDGLERLLYTALERVSSERVEGKHRIDVELELRLIKSLLGSSRQISINRVGQRRRSQRQGIIIHQQRKRKRISINEGLLMLTSLKRSRLPADMVPETSTCTRFEAAGQEFLGTVTFFPANPMSSIMIIASVHQEELRGGHTYSEIPRLLVSGLLPSDAPVFALAREGRVEDLQAMISQGNASFHVRDINGLTLLHHAIGHPSMCRFLIQNGADVNEIAGRNDQTESLPLLGATTRATTSARESPEYVAAIDCIRILLRAGADPTISPKSWDSPFHLACTPKDTDILDIFLELGSDFAHIELADSRGQTPLLRMCSWYSTYTLAAFSYLINRGADISARDNDGATCLHLAIENAKRPLGAEEFEALAYLVRCGADVHATTTTTTTTTTTSSGASPMSVSQVAFETTSTDVVYKLGSYRGDLWMAVLAREGHDVGSFVGRWSREKKKQFTARYTRQDFERLWEGRERLCPYYHDESSGSTGNEDENDNDDAAVDDSPISVGARRRRSLDYSIRQRTDISVTVESVEKVTPLVDGENTSREHQSRKKFGQHDNNTSCCGAATSSQPFVNGPTTGMPSLLWDPSLVHHLMPNPWHDILPGSHDEPVMVEEQETTCDIQLESTSRQPGATEYDMKLGKSCWKGIEMENVWGD